MKFSNHIFVRGQIPVINELIEKPLDIAEAYKLVKFARSLKEKEEDFNEARLKVFKKYGEQNKEGNWEIKDDKAREEAAKEIDKLLEIEEEYDLESKIKVPQDVKLSAAELMLLEDIIEVPEK
jgi:hypothetical protein